MTRYLDADNDLAEKYIAVIDALARIIDERMHGVDTPPGTRMRGYETEVSWGRTVYELDRNDRLETSIIIKVNLQVTDPELKRELSNG